MTIQHTTRAGSSDPIFGTALTSSLPLVRATPTVTGPLGCVFSATVYVPLAFFPTVKPDVAALTANPTVSSVMVSATSTTGSTLYSLSLLNGSGRTFQIRSPSSMLSSALVTI